MNNRTLQLRSPFAALSSLGICAAVACLGCGGGGGGSSGSPAPQNISLSPNTIVYGIASGASAYDINELSPTGATPQSVIVSLPDTELLFAINPALPNSYVIAADPTGSGTYGIYLAPYLTLTGATNIVAPAYSYVSSLSVTQDGKHVVFSATDGTGLSNLFTVPTAGGAVTELGLSDGSAVSPADSDTIAYVAPVGGVGNDQVFTRSLSAGAGGSPTQLTSDASNHVLPSWSPDGTKLAYWEENSGTNTLIVETVATSSSLSLPNPSGLLPQGEAFSADGTTLVIAGELNSQGNIWTQPSNGSAAPTSILSAASLLGNYGVFWTDANGRVAGSVQGMGSASRRKLR